MSFRPKKLVATLRCFFGGEAVARDIFGNDAREQKLQEIICTAGFRATATHFESAERMTADDGAGAGPVDINIARLDLGFSAIDVRRTAREESGGEGVICAIRDVDCFIEIAYF